MRFESNAANPEPQRTMQPRPSRPAAFHVMAKPTGAICNLDCSYCTEYDNSKDHVPSDILRKRIDHCAYLGCLHTDLIGGEPLLHPEVVPLMRYVTQKGMTTGMTTNGFLLTEALLKELIDAGMGKIQISVDALTPSRETPKSLKTLRKKIELYGL